MGGKRKIVSNRWSHNFNHSPVRGYETSDVRYVSERGNSPVVEIPAEPTNRRQRRLAAKVLRKTYEQHDETQEKTYEQPLGNPDLPIASKRFEIVDAIRDNQVSIIVSETGSGKSTQVMQYVLDDLDKNVTLTQPRRIAARNIAQRVDEEVTSVRPEMYGTVAYHTAEVDTRTERTRATVCTDGLRYVKQLHDDGTLQNEVLIIDEVHEWNTNIEMLVAWTRELIQQNPDMRVVLMSATVDAAEISNFYADSTQTIPPIIEVEGRTFEVDKQERAESTIVKELTSSEVLGKNVLCFLPGKGEIKDSIQDVRRKLKQQNIEHMPALIPLHSKLSGAEQDKAFVSYPHGKIVFSTDVAQTSLTIPDIDVVIDSGVKRQKQIDDEGSESLLLVATSQDDCDQRAGRAGRVKEGIYILTRLDSDTKFKSYISRDKRSVPEIARTDVDKNTLHFASVGLDLEKIKTFNSVNDGGFERAKRGLKILGALDENGQITAAGRRMERMSLHPIYARMVLESEQYSLATQAQVAAIAAVGDVGGLKYYTSDNEKRWKELSSENESDLLSQLQLFVAAQHMPLRKIQQYGMDVKNVQRAREQYEKIIRRIGVDPGVLSNPNDNERANIKRCIYAGMIDHIYSRSSNDEYVRINGQAKTPREISNRSVVRGKPMLLAGTPYRVEYYKNGDIAEKHIIENVTKVSSPEVLAEIALHLCSWTTEERKLRGGKLMDVQALDFRGVPMGISREVVAQTDEEAKVHMIKHVMENPGSALRELYSIESRIKELRKLSPHAPKSIHTKIRGLVEQIVSEGNLDESYIDYLIREEGIKLDDFVTPEQIAAIERSSPAVISRHGYDFSLSYEAGTPLVKRFDLAVAANLSEEVVLDDGRIVKFVGEHGKRFTVAMLRNQQVQ